MAWEVRSNPASEKDQAADEELQGRPSLISELDLGRLPSCREFSLVANLSYTSFVVALAENMIVAERFRLNRMIGRGGMGSVWHATHLGLDTACAIKFIEGDFASLPEAHQRFEREAKAAAQLRSPHVVQIMDNGVWEGRPYIAMELLDGTDLRKRLASGPMNPNEIASILTQVCRALTKAHSLGIVHRDLKPDNIFLVRDDDREIAKVLDFGIAKRQDTVDGSNTRTGAMLGTPYYMSPEQAQGVKSVDFRSDLWSLAVIAYQAITGQLPFQSEALGDLLVKIIVHPIPVPSRVAQVPPGFDVWFAKATQRDPNLRYQSAKDFADSLAMAIGASQLTDVMDGRMIRAQIAAGHTAQMGSAPHLPFGSTPQPNMPFGQTPLPGQQSSPGFQSSGGFPAQHGNTGAPFTTTASGATQMPQKSSTTGIIVGGIAAAMVVVLAGVGAFLHFSSHDVPPVVAASASTNAPSSIPSASSAPTVAVTVASATATGPVLAASSVPITTATTPIPTTTAAATNTSAPTTAANEHSNDHGSNNASDSGHTTRPPHATNTNKPGKAETSVDKMGF